MAKIAGRRDIECQFKEDVSSDISRHELCIEKAEKYLGWKPQVKLEDGLQRTWDYFYGNNRNLLI